MEARLGACKHRHSSKHVDSLDDANHATDCINTGTGRDTDPLYQIRPSSAMLHNPTLAVFTNITPLDTVSPDKTSCYRPSTW